MYISVITEVSSVQEFKTCIQWKLKARIEFPNVHVWEECKNTAIPKHTVLLYSMAMYQQCTCTFPSPLYNYVTFLTTSWLASSRQNMAAITTFVFLSWVWQTVTAVTAYIVTYCLKPCTQTVLHNIHMYMYNGCISAHTVHTMHMCLHARINHVTMYSIGHEKVLIVFLFSLRRRPIGEAV